MSKPTSKLGRNPLRKMGEQKGRSLPALDTVQGSSRNSQELPILEKIKELQIQVDWEELYRATVENKIKQISRFFLRF